MAAAAEKLPPATTGGELQKVAALLGGAKVLSCPLASPLDAHELLLDGLPASALDRLVGQLLIIGETKSLEKAVGMSLRTWQRRTELIAWRLDQAAHAPTWDSGEGAFRVGGRGTARASGRSIARSIRRPPSSKSPSTRVSARSTRLRTC